RDPLGDGDDHADARVGRFHDRVGRAAGRDEDHRGVRARFRYRLRNRVEHRQRRPRFLAGPGGPALLGRDAADKLRAVLEALVGVKPPGRAGDPLADDAGVLVNEDAHAAVRPYASVEVWQLWRRLLRTAQE